MKTSAAFVLKVTIATFNTMVILVRNAIHRAKPAHLHMSVVHVSMVIIKTILRVRGVIWIVRDVKLVTII